MLTRAGLRLFAPKKLLFEINQLENLNPSEGVHFQQVDITGDQNLGLCRNGQRQKWIVLGVSAFCDRGGGLYENHGLAEKAQPDQAMFKRSPGIELFTRENRGQLIERGCRTKNIMRQDGAAKNIRGFAVWIQAGRDERTRIKNNSFTGVAHGLAR